MFTQVLSEKVGISNFRGNVPFLLNVGFILLASYMEAYRRIYTGLPR